MTTNTSEYQSHLVSILTTIGGSTLVLNRVNSVNSTVNVFQIGLQRGEQYEAIESLPGSMDIEEAKERFEHLFKVLDHAESEAIIKQKIGKAAEQMETSLHNIFSDKLAGNAKINWVPKDEVDPAKEQSHWGAFS